MKRVAFALLLVALAASPVHSANLWGSSGLVTMPDAQVLHGREIELGGTYLSLPAHDPAIAGFARYGIVEGLEASLVYGVPNYPWVTGSFKYQLLAPSPGNPMAAAIGASLLGVPVGGAIAGTHYFMSLSRSLSPFWGTAHLGFMGDLALNARLMMGWEFPLGRFGAIKAEAFGPQSGAAPNSNVGIALTPFSWLSLTAASLGTPTQDLLVRGLTLGASIRTMVPDFSRLSPSLPQAPSVRVPPSPVPSSPPAFAGKLAPPTLPTATLVGRILGGDGEPRGGFRVRMDGQEREARSTANGYFFFSALTPGRYALQVSDPDGKPATSVAAEIKEGGPFNLNISLEAGKAAVALRGIIAGEIMGGDPAKPIAGARITVMGPGLSVLTLSTEEGLFRVIDLPPGDYRLKAERQGFASGTGTARLAEKDLLAEVKLKLQRGD